MRVTIELIDELRSRVNVSYEEAKRVLEKNDGDLIKSIIELENKKKASTNCNNKSKDGFSDFADRVLQFRLCIWNREGNTVLNVPLLLAVLVLIMAFWVVLFCFVVTIFTSCKIKIFRTNSNNRFSDLKDNVKHSVNKVKKTADEIFKSEIKNNKNEQYSKEQYEQNQEYKSNKQESNDSKNNSNSFNDDDEIIIE